MYKEGEVKIIRGTHWTAPGCHNGCGLLYHVKDGKIIKVEGDPDHPFNQGLLCPRCLALTQYIYHPDRILYPLKRAGERGEGKWERISWEEAYSTTYDKFSEIRSLYGGPSIVFVQGTGRDIGGWIMLLAYSAGSPNWIMAFLSGIACYTPFLAAQHAVLGSYTDPDCSQWLEARYESPIWKVPKAMIFWGSNEPYVNSLIRMGHWAVECMRRGTEIIAVNPAYDWFQSRAKYWLRTRPGTDALIAMAFVKTVIEEDLYDRDWVLQWTNAPFLVRTDTRKLLRESDVRKEGKRENFLVWDEARNDVVTWNSNDIRVEVDGVKPALKGERTISLADGEQIKCETVWDVLLKTVNTYSLDQVEEMTWVPKKDIVEAARFYGKSRPASNWTGVAIDQQVAGMGAQQAIVILGAITHNVDVPGGDIVVGYPYNISAYPYDSSAQMGQKAMVEMLKLEDKLKRIGINKYPVVANFRTWAHSDETLNQLITGEPYPIKGMWIQTSNFLATGAPDPRKVSEGMKKLDFVVVADLFMTPTAQACADIILPVCTHAEKISVKTWWQLCAMTKPIEPLGESKSDLEINLELGRRFNPNMWPWNNVEEMLDDLLKPSAMTFKQLSEKSWALEPPDHYYYRWEKARLRRDGKKGFNTPSGRIELWSSRLEDWGQEPLPYHLEPPHSPITTPDVFKEYPLIMMTGKRSAVLFHSEHRATPWLRELEPDPVVEIHPDAAKPLGINSGDWVWIENQFGKCKRRAKLDLKMHPKLIQVPHAWWLPEVKDPKRLFDVFELNVNQLIPIGLVGPTGLACSYKSMSARIYKESA